jgi:UDP-3-O-[3-hydroxymyristoyl] glucosamine N-acyltransferase
MSQLPSGAGQGLPVADIVSRLGGTLHGDASVRVLRFAPLERAQAGDVAFLARAEQGRQLEHSHASCVIVPQGVAPDARFAAVIQAVDPYLYYARLSQWLQQLDAPEPMRGRHATAVVHDSARVANDAYVDACAVIERDAVIGARVHVGAGCFVGAGAVIGADTRLLPRSVVMHGCRIGERCTLHPGAVVGADGFGWARDERGAGVRIAQTGSVVIGDDVDIGANTTVDRGALDDTRIADGVKIDNLVQVAHNVQIGAHTALAGCVGIAGSARIGAYCFIGGGVGIAGHLEIADRTVIGGMSLVSRSVRQPGHYTGAFPLDRHENWSANAAALRHLAELRERIRRLESRLESQNNPAHDKP